MIRLSAVTFFLFNFPFLCYLFEGKSYFLTSCIFFALGFSHKEDSLCRSDGKLGNYQTGSKFVEKISEFFGKRKLVCFFLDDRDEKSGYFLFSKNKFLGNWTIKSRESTTQEGTKWEKTRIIIFYEFVVLTDAKSIFPILPIISFFSQEKENDPKNPFLWFFIENMLSWFVFF